MNERWSAGGAVVLGAGTMGRGITQLLLQAGAPVLLVDPQPGAAAAAKAALGDTFAMLRSKGRLAAGPDSLLEWLAVAETLPRGNRAEWVFEAAPEDLELKRALFADVEARAPFAKLATNTSTLSVTAIAAACREPARVVGVHFFNPAPLMPLVEVIAGVHTPPALVQQAVAMARTLGRTPVVAQDRPGFIVNRLARPYYLEAVRLLAEGAPVASVDAAMRAAGFRMGPFELLDLIGIDINLAASESVYEASFQEPRYRPHPLQRSLVAAGRLGRKAGWGFYRYEGDAPVEPARVEPQKSRVAQAGAEPQKPRVAQAGAEPQKSRVAQAGAESQPAPVNAPATAHVLGEGPVARWLRARFESAPSAAEADLIVDARVGAPDDSQAPGAPEPPRASGAPAPPRASGTPGAPRLTLCWGRSAPAGGVGFSVLPPPSRLAQAPPATLELLAPPGATATPDMRLVTGLLHDTGFSTLEVPDQAGGVAFRLLAGLVNEAFSALAEGLADASMLDLAMRLGVNYPEGPLAWADELGLADVLAGLEGLRHELGAERYAPHPLLRQFVKYGTSASGA